MFIVQDDLGEAADANAYETVQEFKDYWTDRGEDYTTLTDAVIQSAIVQGTQYLDIRYEYTSYPLNGRDQTTEFPRTYLYDSHGYRVEGVPREVKEACAEYTKVALANDLTITALGTDSIITEKRSKVGPIEKSEKYAGGTSMSSGTFAVIQTPDNLLWNSGFVSNTNKVPIRG